MSGEHKELIDLAALVSRRTFVKGSSIATLAAGLQGCIRRPEDKILPYSRAPEQVIPGVASHFATVTPRGRDALGVVVTSHDGRPTKVEGNALHSMSEGKTDVAAQAYVWNLYDPDRSKNPAWRNNEDGVLEEASYADFERAFDAIRVGHVADKGKGLRLLAPVHNSPSFRRLRDAVLERFPQAKFYTYSSVNDDNVREGARIAWGKPYAVVPDYDRAAVVLSLDSDFVGDEPGSVRAGHEFGYKRQVASPQGKMNRLYSVESNHSITGSMADHRLRLSAGDIERYARALARELGVETGAVDASGIPEKWLKVVAADLKANEGKSVVVVGSGQPAHVHALGHAINAALGNIDKTVTFGPAVDENETASTAGLNQLADEIDSVRTLVILGGNPAYDAPAELDFAGLLTRPGLTSVHLATHRDETSERSSWHLPMAHGLEAWGDHAAADGTLSIQQPLIAPLYGGRSALELLATLAGEEETRGHDIVKKTLGERSTSGTLFPQTWRKALHSGVAARARPVTVTGLNGAAVSQAVKAARALEPATKDGLQVKFVPDHALGDGVFANNLWMLELPDPMTKIVWDNVALVSRATRDALGLKNGDMARLSRGKRSVELPVWALPGHADWSITLHLGWGRRAAGRYGSNKGFDVHPLRTSDAFYIADGVKVESLGKSYRVVQTQVHDKMEHRPLALEATFEDYKKKPDFASYETVEMVNTPPLWKEQDYSEGHKWGMTIDLSACNGCSACVVACQAENNIPSVGKLEVERGREMSWIRLDRYFVGDDEDKQKTAIQPVACQQCEEAPCENVCPVNATVHSPEGLNDMVYNRCVGTRYCANNCPYKVRRFNYVDYHTQVDDRFKMYGDFEESRKLQFNPNVTVRMRGVMEKCTYCVQRIQEQKIAAKRDDRELKDGDIVTACQAACPTSAIVFGDLNDPKSRVADRAKVDRKYKLLAEIGTQPRTTYLARIRNVNPAMGEHA